MGRSNDKKLAAAEVLAGLRIEMAGLRAAVETRLKDAESRLDNHEPRLRKVENRLAFHTGASAMAGSLVGAFAGIVFGGQF